MDRPLRILSLIGGLGYGGDEKRLLTMAKHMDAARFEHCLVTFYDDDDVFDRMCGRMAEEFLEAGVTLRSLRLRRSNGASVWQMPRRLGLWAVALTRLIRIVREQRCDVIDAHLFGSNFLGICAGALTRTPVAVTYYDRINAAPILRRPAVRWTIKNAAAVITDSQIRGDEYRQVASARARRFAVIPNGVAPPRPSLLPAEVKACLDVPQGTGPIVAQISRLEPFKGQCVLLDAAQLALRQRPDLFFLIVGFTSFNTDYAESLDRRARELGIADRVRILGYQGVIGDVWSIVDVHAHASLYDSLPNAIIEGMSLGKPLVATTVGGIPEMVEHERTGLLVPPNDAAAMAGAILRIVDDSDFAQSLGRAAHQRYFERCEPRAFASKLECLFTELAAHPRPFASADGNAHTSTVNSPVAGRGVS